VVYHAVKQSREDDRDCWQRAAFTAYLSGAGDGTTFGDFCRKWGLTKPQPKKSSAEILADVEKIRQADKRRSRETL